MKKKNEPLITHVEILARAARTLQDDIEKWEAKRDVMGSDIDVIIAPIGEKLHALNTMYKIETGVPLNEESGG
jgi:threonyl-tRNA synthetase